MSVHVPVTTVFVGLSGFISFSLSCIVVIERVSTGVWHGESKSDVNTQLDYLESPNIVVRLIGKYARKLTKIKTEDDGLLQRKARAQGNFTEYIPLALLFILALELTTAPIELVWIIGAATIIGRLFHAYGVIRVYGPSPFRAAGFLLTLLCYLVSSSACLYYAFLEL